MTKKTTINQGRKPVGAPTNQKEQDFIEGGQVGTASQDQISNPLLDLNPKAPRKYKSIAMHFNRYEFERLDDAVANTDMGKSKFIRAALEVACKKALK